MTYFSDSPEHGFSIGLARECAMSPICEIQHREMAAEEIRVAYTNLATFVDTELPPQEALVVTRCDTDCPGRNVQKGGFVPLQPDIIVTLRSKQEQ